MKTKEEVLQEVLKDMLEAREVGDKVRYFPNISPWGGSEVSTYIINELDRLGYTLYAFHFISGGKPKGGPSGLKVVWK